MGLVSSMEVRFFIGAEVFGKLQPEMEGSRPARS